MKVEDIYSDYIHTSRYARYLDEEGRRETWPETVGRFCDFFERYPTGNVSTEDEFQTWLSDCRTAIERHDVMPSMRALMTAGPALERDNVAGYNCAYVPIDDRRVFDEIMYILMCGTGVGFSVERENVNKLPTIAPEFFDDESITIHVADSRIGWATAYRKLISSLYDGFVPSMDFSNVRPAGTRLKTFGGRASGPDPLKELCNYTINTFKNAKGRKLNDLECHDLVCKIAEVIVCGGVRRSALISLSNVTSDRMRTAKSGQWYFAEPHRALANNSAAYTEKPDTGLFLKEWTSLYESKSGERGIFSRVAASNSLPDRREPGHEWGTNPCSEIILRPRQFCNLTEVVGRPEDTYEDLKRKVRQAAFLGTLQSTLTNFRYLGSKWKQNCEEERLLGVSITGIMDCPTLSERPIGGNLEHTLRCLRRVARATNFYWADKLGIPRSAAITCVKPSGTVSQLVNASSGIHPRYSHYYIRRVRNDIKDPLSKHLVDQGVPHEVDNHNPNQLVFSFPIQAPETSETVHSISAIRQLEIWKTYAEHWCEHKPSVSIYVREHEWLEVGAWVYENFDILSGVSFFPYDDHVYPQAPYEAISEDDYERLVSEFPINVGLTGFSEEEDNTTSSQELACSGPNGCEL